MMRWLQQSPRLRQTFDKRYLRRRYGPAVGNKRWRCWREADRARQSFACAGLTAAVQPKPIAANNQSSIDTVITTTRATVGGAAAAGDYSPHVDLNLRFLQAMIMKTRTASDD